jgi:Spy/CpxP family protein refolding chaperone
MMGVALITFAMLPAAGFGQDMPAGKWWHNPGIVQELNLSKNDTKRLDGLYADSRRRLIELKNDVEKEQFELDQLMSSRKADDQAVRKQFKRLEQARSNLANERFRFVMGVRDILGQERFEQLKASYKKWQ